MSAILFSARWVDWSGSPCWSLDGDGIACGSRETRYTVYDDGSCESDVLKYKLSPGSFDRLKTLLKGDFLLASTHHDAFDGVGWEMTLYDNAGNVVHTTGLGYIYGVEALEEIAGILQGGLPKMDLDLLRLILSSDSNSGKTASQTPVSSVDFEGLFDDPDQEEDGE